MLVLRLKSLPTLAACLMLAGCGAIPWSTQLKLRSFDPLTFDPAVPRAAVMITDRLRVLPGQARVHLSYWRKDAPAAKTTETFTLQEVNEPAPDTLAASRNDDERIAVFRLSPADVVRAGYDAGVLTAPAADNVVRILPALNIPDSDITEALARLDAAATALKPA